MLLYGQYALQWRKCPNLYPPSMHCIAKQKAYRPRPIKPLVKFYVLSFECMREYLELE